MRLSVILPGLDGAIPTVVQTSERAVRAFFRDSAHWRVLSVMRAQVHNCWMTFGKETVRRKRGIEPRASAFPTLACWLLLVTSGRKWFNKAVSFSTGWCRKYSPIKAVTALMADCWTFESAEARHSRNAFNQRSTTASGNGKPPELRTKILDEMANGYAHWIAAETPPETLLQDVDTSLGNGFHRGIT